MCGVEPRAAGSAKPAATGAREPTFRTLVYALLECVPHGRVTSYGRLAAALGHPRRAREVGWALASIPEEAQTSAHRVVNRDGVLSGGWAFGHPAVQRALLESEGVTFLPDGRVDLGGYLWSEEAARTVARRLLSRDPLGLPLDRRESTIGNVS